MYRNWVLQVTISVELTRHTRRRHYKRVHGLVIWHVTIKNRTRRVGDDEDAGNMVCFQGYRRNLLDVRTQKYACTAHVGAKRPCMEFL